MCSPKCQNSLCCFCNDINIAHLIKSTANTIFNWKIEGNLNCNMENVIYLIQHKTCSFQYVWRNWNKHLKKKELKSREPFLSILNIRYFPILPSLFYESGFCTTRDRKEKESEYRFMDVTPLNLRALNERESAFP